MYSFICFFILICILLNNYLYLYVLYLITNEKQKTTSYRTTGPKAA